MKNQLTRFEKWQHRAVFQIEKHLGAFKEKHPRFSHLAQRATEHWFIYVYLVLAAIIRHFTDLPLTLSYLGVILIHLLYVIIKGGIRIKGLGPIHIIFVPDNWNIARLQSLDDFLRIHQIRLTMLVRCRHGIKEDKKILPVGMFKKTKQTLAFLPKDLMENARKFWSLEKSRLGLNEIPLTWLYLGLTPEESEQMATGLYQRNYPYFAYLDFASDGIWVTLTRRGRVKRLTTITKVLSGWSDATSGIPADQAKTQ